MVRIVLRKIVVVLNLLVAVFLLFSYFLPYISPESFGLAPILSLAVPVLIVSNIIFVIFWIFKRDKKVFLSISILILSYFFSSPFYNFSNTKNFLEDDLCMISYNVHLLNTWKSIKQDHIGLKIVKFIEDEKPDVIAFQEFHKSYVDKFNFKYRYFIPNNLNGKHGQAIFSNYEIINKGSLNFQKSSNNAIFIDIVKNNDTIRVYNVHLQSLGIALNKENFGSKDPKSLVGRLEDKFKKQASQVNLILEHQKNFSGKTIICGDFNNTAYSWVYRQLAQEKKDAFLDAGKGFGKTFNFYFPMRIDFILVDNTLDVNWFENYSNKFSDHEAVMARINTGIE